MKQFFESWRTFINERIDYIPPKEQPEFDIGSTFPKLYIGDMILYPHEDTTKKIVFLDIFNQLEAETDESKIRHILKSLQQMSGNSRDFTFDTKQTALRFYKTPYKYKAHPEDSKPTKSLKDYHTHMKVINSNPGESRAIAIKDFYSTSDKYNPVRTKFTRDPDAKKDSFSDTLRAKR